MNWRMSTAPTKTCSGASTSLLQIAHMILQLVERGSLLRRAAGQYGKAVLALYGSFRNIARRLLDCLRYRLIPGDAFDPNPRIQIRLDSS